MATTRPPIVRAWLSLGGGAGATFLIIGALLVVGVFPGPAAAHGPFLTRSAVGGPLSSAGPVSSVTPLVSTPEQPTAPAVEPPSATVTEAQALAPVPTGGERGAQAPPTADHTVMAPPSVSAALIDQVLQQYNSPAAGQGAVFYDLGVQYGIDPAYALAFFIHESSAGTKGVARFTNAIGNIRTTPGYRDYEGYRAYDTWAAGIEDWYKLIKTLYVEGWGKRTVAQIIPTYAPSADRNDPPSYTATVTQLVDGWQR